MFAIVLESVGDAESLLLRLHAFGMRLDAEDRPVRLVLVAPETPATVSALLSAVSAWQSEDGHSPVQVAMDEQIYLLETRESDGDTHRP